MNEFYNPIIIRPLCKLLKWLQTWETGNGGYNGYVVHRLDSKRMFKIHDTSWSQAPMIEGYINLYKKTKDKKWLELAVRAGDLQTTRLLKSGKYRYAGFEDDRFCSLVHCSLANIALLDLAILLRNVNCGYLSKSKVYIDCVLKNVDFYLIKKLWVEKEGAFKVNEIDYYSPNKDRFIVNMNCIAVENLIKLNILTRGDYSTYIERLAKWIPEQQIRNSNELLNGAIRYEKNSSEIVTLYTGLSLQGIKTLYEYTNDDKFKEIMFLATKNLLKLVDQNTKLFYHGLRSGIVMKYPQFIAGTGIILKGINDTEVVTKIKFDYEFILQEIFDYQLDTGGFQNFYGYRIKGKRIIPVWEDYVPVVGWNAHLFEFLTRIIPENIYLNEKPSKKSIQVNRSYYFYHESSKIVIILGKKPFKSMVFILIVKKLKISLLYFSPYKILRFIGSFLPIFIKEKIRRILKI